jgi:hypothetical protein
MALRIATGSDYRTNLHLVFDMMYEGLRGIKKIVCIFVWRYLLKNMKKYVDA